MANAFPRLFRRSAAGFPLLTCLLATPLIAQTSAQAPAQMPATSPTLAPALATSRDYSFAAEQRPVRLDQVPGHVQVFILEDLERNGARTLGEFLAQELPAQFQQTGGPGLPTQAYQGGGRPQDTVVLLDGMRLSDPSQLAPDLDAIPLSGIVRVEVLTGSDSARQGPGAQGGIVAIFTAGAAERGSMGEIAGQGGNSGQSQGRALPSFGWGSGWLHVGSQARQEDAPTDTTLPYRATTNFIGIGQRLGPLTVALSYRNHYQGVPDPYLVPNVFTRLYDDGREAGYRDQAGGLGLQLDLAPGANITLNAGGEGVDRLDPREGGTQLYRTTGRTNQVDLAFNFGTPIFGLSVRAGGFESRGQRPVSTTVTDDGRVRHTGFGLELRFQPVPRLRFTAEGGFNTEHRLLEPTGLAVTERTDHATAFKTTMNLQLIGGLRFYAGGGQGYTAPSLQQLLLNARAGGPDLDLERSGSGFAGFGWGRGNWTGRLESNRTTYRDAIGISGFTYANVEHVRVQGTEATVGYNRGGFGAEGFARAQEAKDLTNGTDPYGTDASAERPFHSHGLKLHYGWTRVRLDLRYRETGASYQIAGPPLRGVGASPIIATRTVFRELSTVATFVLGKHWTLIARGEHLLQPKTTVDDWLTRQTDYENNANRSFGLPSPGPNGSLEVIFRY